MLQPRTLLFLEKDVAWIREPVVSVNTLNKALAQNRQHLVMLNVFVFAGVPNA